MTVSPELFTAILAMDAYNRGYGAGVDITGTQIGDATIGADSSILRDGDNQRLDVPAGFYAIAYDWNGQTVISYRGTDNYSLIDSASDVYNGWPLGIGSLNAPQAALATEFLASVTTEENKGQVLLIGHSLGCGLAGFLSRSRNSECPTVKGWRHVTLQLGKSRQIIMGEIVCAHYRDGVVDPANLHVDPAAVDAIARLGGDTCATIRDRFDMLTPKL